MKEPPEAFRRILAGRYTLRHPLGEGGRATVFVATDLRHDREVALKVLDPELTAILGTDRFLQEIQVTAKLLHPNIIPLFDSGEAAGLLYYVMPFVAGESLRARLNRERQLPVRDALDISRDAAAALDHAHRQGVVHRDIKPENILLHDGTALVADFGIALAMEVAGGSRITQTGFSPGTPHYMSPEQAGAERDLDGRSDIYSLACVTYEMLAGRPPFVASSTPSVVKKVMTEDPEPVRAHRKAVPPGVERAVQVALEKLPADRQQSAAEFASQLEEGAAGGLDWAPGGPGAGWRDRRRLAVVGTAGLVLGGLLGALLFGGSEPEEGPVRLTLPLAEATLAGMRPLAVAPDGRCVAYTTQGPLYVHCLDDFAPVALPGTQGVFHPVFSADGQWIAYQNDSFEAFRQRITGGPPIKICDCGWSGATWGADGTIVFSAWGTAGLMALPPGGGAPRRLTESDPSRGEINHTWPHFLPDGRTVLFSVETREGTSTAATDLTSGAWRPVHPEGIVAGYLRSGHLVYGQQDRVWAVPFDPGSLEVRGEPVPLMELPASPDRLYFALSHSGTLVYVPSAAGPAREELVTVDARGRVRVLRESEGFRRPRLSPDGTRAAFSMGSGEVTDIWIHDLERGALTRVTESGSNIAPVWSPDGRELAFASRDPTTTDPYQIHRALADGTSGPRRLLESPRSQYPHSWSRDGRALAFYEEDPARTDIWVLDLGREGEPTLVAGGAGDQYAPAFSPDGRFLAYVSNESGRDEVYLVSYPGGGRKWTVSSDGGKDPVWDASGRELFFRRGSTLWSVPVEPETGLGPAPPRKVLDLPFSLANLGGRGRVLDRGPGDGFLAVRSVAASPVALHVVLGWDREIRARLGG